MTEEGQRSMEIGMNEKNARRELRLRTPRTGGSVWPDQGCPVFSPRTVVLGGMGGCWYCRYGNFHLRERVALEVGICCWPKAQID